MHSLGALALALPVVRLAKYCAAKQLVQVLRKHVLGPSAKPEVVAELTQRWMNNPVDDPKLRLHESELASSLARAYLPNSATVARPLYAAVSGNNRAYHRNGIFARDALRLEGEWQEGQLLAVQSRISELSVNLPQMMLLPRSILKRSFS